jgi:hypothetical protein
LSQRDAREPRRRRGREPQGERAQEHTTPNAERSAWVTHLALWC